MNRPGGVTVSAAFLFLLGLTAAMMGAIALRAAQQPASFADQFPFAQPLSLLLAVVLFACALLSAFTAAGLFKMKQWARTSIVVIGGMLVCVCGLSLVLLVGMRFLVPELYLTSGMENQMSLLISLYLIPVVPGIWWLVYFNRAAIKADFSREAAQPSNPHPLSIVVIAWHAVAFGLMNAPCAITDWPAFIFGIVLTGWTAKFAYLLFGAVMLAIGIGMLRLKPWAHTAAVWFCVYGAAHSTVFAFLPDKTARTTEFIQLYSQTALNEGFAVTDAIVWFVIIFTWLTFGTALWYLFTRKKAFLEAAKSQQAAA